MPKKIDLTNQKVGRLRVLHEVGKDKSGHYRWECECECGNRVVVSSYHLRAEKIKSCGCLLTERNIEFNKGTKTKHGMRNTKLYAAWSSMKRRCKDINNPNYGGRGITVCPEWAGSFETFRDWALANGYRDDLTIERKDVNGDYCPENCCWATQKTQANNRRNNTLITYQGKTKTLTQWADELGIPRERVYKRVETNHTIEEILFVGKLPTHRRNHTK